MCGGPVACLSPCRPSVLCSVVLREASLCRKGEDTTLLNGDVLGTWVVARAGGCLGWLSLS